MNKVLRLTVCLMILLFLSSCKTATINNDNLKSKYIVIDAIEITSEDNQNINSKYISKNETYTDTYKNKYFFEADTYNLKYNVKHVYGEHIEGYDFDTVNLYISNFKTIDDGTIYKLTFDETKKIPKDRLTLFLFVTADKIYKVNGTEEIISKIKTKTELLQHSNIVCQSNELEDELKPDEQGEHFYTLNVGDRCEYHYYCLNEDGNTNYFETIYFEEEKGLVYFQSGMKAEANLVEFTRVFL